LVRKEYSTEMKFDGRKVCFIFTALTRYEFKMEIVD